MKNQYIKSNSTRQTNSSLNSINPNINKSQLASRLKVIEFLKDQLYPTGLNKISIIYLFLKLKSFV